ncbi:MAG: ferredoxin [Peptococcales bacterium]|jgi:ferredoxin
MKKVFIVVNRCLGCGTCVDISPNHFSIDSTKHAKFLGFNGVEDDNQSDYDAIKTAAKTCPAHAIVIW